jgi:transposase
MNRVEDILARRGDLAALVAQGTLALLERILHLEQERDAALARARTRTPIGDSRTTHAPPSSDPRGKQRSQRRRSGRKSGGQPGHAGHRLEPVDQPDQVVEHTLDQCGHCGHDLRRQAVEDVAVHQVFDLPHLPLVVTEHRCERKTCPHCRTVLQAAPPAGAEQPTQYGPRLAALAVFLHIGQFVPLKRTVDIIATLTGRCVSEGWISACRRRAAQGLTAFKEAVTRALCAAPSVCCDETGFRFAGRRFWLHVCCTVTLTLLLCHRRRGAEATRAMGVLPGYTGIAVHDHWSPYFTFTDCRHAVCNEHLVRELDGVVARDGARWAKRLKIILYDGLKLKRQFHHQGLPIPRDRIAAITRRYRTWVRTGYAHTPGPPPTPAARGRPRRGKTLALLDRLRDHEDATLRFLHEPDVPWSNNQAEQDIRPAKTLMKIIGGFRTERGAEEFCIIRSYLSTTRKNGIHPFDAIASALAGKPWLPHATVGSSAQSDQVAA